MEDIRVDVTAVLNKYIDALSQANYRIMLLEALLEDKQKEIDSLKEVKTDETMDNKCT